VLLITNDVDEGILLADRIIALTVGPGATLSESVAIDIPRPRDRKALNHDPNFAIVRAKVYGQLRASKHHREQSEVRAKPQIATNFELAAEV
jgi:nitrate/nitrite transport system ATP-binding protein